MAEAEPGLTPSQHDEMQTTGADETKPKFAILNDHSKPFTWNDNEMLNNGALDTVLEVLQKEAERDVKTNRILLQLMADFEGTISAKLFVPRMNEVISILENSFLERLKYISKLRRKDRQSSSNGVINNPNFFTSDGHGHEMLNWVLDTVLEMLQKKNDMDTKTIPFLMDVTAKFNVGIISADSMELIISSIYGNLQKSFKERQEDISKLPLKDLQSSSHGVINNGSGEEEMEPRDSPTEPGYIS
ncbi:uncharacterized protein LOC132204704 [Neocloeon triangulifer]|uniref:uncharacterized protein LOC132204704 n=1 Tax=Neocloeon triangulifer TaxID=2078957 RepID=UPI00286ED061|nr:uncharacterized protein LOC132204704 [Neocloeon triangulifer]